MWFFLNLSSGSENESPVQNHRRISNWQQDEKHFYLPSIHTRGYLCNPPQGSGSSCQSIPQLWRLPLSTKDRSFPGRYNFYSQSFSLMGVRKNKWKDHWLLPALTFKIWQPGAYSGVLLSRLFSFSHSALDSWWIEHKEDERIVNTCNPLACQNDILSNPIMINIGCVQREVKMHRSSHFSSQNCLLSLHHFPVGWEIENRWRILVRDHWYQRIHSFIPSCILSTNVYES